MQYEASTTVYIGREANKKMYQNGYHLKNCSQNDWKSNHHMLEVYVNIHTKDEASMNIYR